MIVRRCESAMSIKGKENRREDVGNREECHHRSGSLAANVPSGGRNSRNASLCYRTEVLSELAELFSLLSSCCGSALQKVCWKMIVIRLHLWWSLKGISAHE